MVKLFAFVRRREGMDVDGFRRHWRDVHGPLIRDTPGIGELVVRYEQHPRHREDAMSGTAGYDGVAVQWFRSVEDFHRFVQAPAYAEVIAPDEARFLDPGSVMFLVTDEPHVVIDGPVR